MNSYEDIVNEIDKRQLLNKLYEYYGTHCLEHMALMIKRDLKDPKKMRCLIDYVEFDDKDFFTYMGMMFFEVFNKMTIKKIRLNLNVDEPEESEDDC
jgi:hypothetical protein